LSNTSFSMWFSIYYVRKRFLRAKLIVFSDISWFFFQLLGSSSQRIDTENVWFTFHIKWLFPRSRLFFHDYSFVWNIVSRSLLLVKSTFKIYQRIMCYINNEKYWRDFSFPWRVFILNQSYCISFYVLLILFLRVRLSWPWSYHNDLIFCGEGLLDDQRTVLQLYDLIIISSRLFLVMFL
jgi:hypothetical protein